MVASLFWDEFINKEVGIRKRADASTFLTYREKICSEEMSAVMFLFQLRRVSFISISHHQGESGQFVFLLMLTARHPLPPSSLIPQLFPKLTHRTIKKEPAFTVTERTDKVLSTK